MGRLKRSKVHWKSMTKMSRLLLTTYWARTWVSKSLKSKGVDQTVEKLWLQPLWTMKELRVKQKLKETSRDPLLESRGRMRVDQLIEVGMVGLKKMPSVCLR